MIYSSSDRCQQQLSGIEAIDYFFARQMVMELDQADNALLFYLMLALQWSLRQGHVCLPLKRLSASTFWQDHDNNQPGFRFPTLKKITTCLDVLSLTPEDEQPVVLQNESLYLRRYWQFEVEVSAALRSRMPLSVLDAEQQARARAMFARLFPVKADDASNHEPDWQQVAAANALGRRLSVISGGPGTGKTYTVIRLLAVLQAAHQGRLRIQMAAPTGKAAQRLKESISQSRSVLKNQGIAETIVDSIPEQAATLHRLLGFRPYRLNLSHDAEHPLRCDLLLIDEASMIDLAMMARLLRALPDTAGLILLGDAEQLPSVETGSVLADITCREHPGYHPDAVQQIKLLSSQRVKLNAQSHYSHLTQLTQTHRFSGEIARLAREVIQADHQSSWKRLIRYQVQQINFVNDDERELNYLADVLFDPWLKKACQHYVEKISQAPDLLSAFTALGAFRLLAPTRVGERGVESLNATIEKLLNHHHSVIRPGQHYRGRPIMVSQNSYATGLFNGDVGLIWPDEKGRLLAWFEQEEGGYRSISLARLPLVETVYAMTIHKTQGSEFNHVAIILPRQESQLLSPELLYTGLTRARQQLFVIGNEDIWRAALAERAQRYSGLRLRLEQ